jgi:hypothetical protein
VLLWGFLTILCEFCRSGFFFNCMRRLEIWVFCNSQMRK